MRNEEYYSPRQNTWVNVRQIKDGWNVFDDAQDIKDTELADIQNITYDKGFPTPRKGSQLKWAAPIGETNPLLCLFAARASDGTNYAIAVYAPNFYLRDEINNQWVKINSAYTPDAAYKLLMYGYTNWNAGIGSDVLYAGNGTEKCIKWQIGAGYVKTLASAGAVAITLSDSTKFPSTGTIVIQASGGSPVYTTYSANNTTTGVLTVPALGADVVVGSVITGQILSIALSATTMPIANIFKVFQQRLIVTGGKGAECTVKCSVLASPEDFTVGTTFPASITEVIADGRGGIIGLDVFGEYLTIEKQDSFHRMSIDSNTIAQSTGSITTATVTITPVIGDVSMGPVQPWAKIKKNNLLYYASLTEGIFSIDPTITGSQSSIGVNVLSQIIRPYVETLDFTNTRTTSFNQKLLWSTTSNAIGDGVLMYDLLRNVWSKFTNWNVKDWLIHNEVLFFGSRLDGNIYQTFVDAKVDGETPYEAFLLTKAFDFGKSSIPKTTDAIFVSGYISPQETLFFEVILTTGDKIVTIPYSLSGNGDFTVVSIPKALAMIMLGGFNLGEATLDKLTGIFKAYLAIPFRFGWFTLQVRVHSKVNGTDWGLTGLGFNPIHELKHPAAMTIGAIGDSTNNSITTVQSGESNQFLLGDETFIVTS